MQLTKDKSEIKFPYLLVNIGSGVSIFKVESETSFKRISGSSIGGGTYYGLCKLLTKSEEYKKVVSLTEKGDNRNVDLKVGDIYGQAYSSIGLDTDTIASFFGRIPRMKSKDIAYLLFLSQEHICLSIHHFFNTTVQRIVQEVFYLWFP